MSLPDRNSASCIGDRKYASQAISFVSNSSQKTKGIVPFASVRSARSSPDRSAVTVAFELAENLLSRADPAAVSSRGCNSQADAGPTEFLRAESVKCKVISYGR